ncbi:oligosaccharide flippase family protein [Flavobacteriaceae bacterium]|nr:oligosaccharide flippase family protein [Flavobacteriaceae bacterium]MDC0506975.1 oligosaccharide flippase family protein [Flavobacteriaceae bacterium]
MIKNIIANFIGKFWGILSNFLFIPLYIHYLGFESYAIISFTLVVGGLMAVLDAGLTATLSREFARVDNSHLEKIRIFKTLETLYFILIGLSIILVFGFSDTIANKWLNLNTFDPNRVSFFLKIISFDIGFQLLFRFYMGGLLGLEKQVKANIYQVGWGMLRNGLVVVAIWVVPTLEMFFIWQTMATVIFAILLLLSLNKTLTGTYKFYFKLKIERSIFENVWRFAGGMFLISLVASLNTQMDKLIISKLLPIEILGYYTLAVSISIIIVVLVTPISVALLPRFTALYSAGKKGDARIFFHKINLFVNILVFSVMANISFFSKTIIWVWTDEMNLAEEAYIYLPIIALSFAMLAIATIPYNIAIANGYTKLNNVLGIISLCVTLPGYWIATQYYGAIGAASVFCVVQIIITLIYIYKINSKFLKEKKISKLYINQILLPLIIPLIIAFGFSFIPESFETSRILSLIWIGVSTILSFYITIKILISKKEFKFIISKFLKVKI